MKIRLKYIAEIDMGQSPPSSEYTTAELGIPFLQGTAEFGAEYPEPQVYALDPHKIAHQHDILFSVRAPVGDLNIANQALGIGRGLCAIRAKTGIHHRFIWWALHESRQQLKIVETGSTYSAVSVEEVSNMAIPDIPLAKQVRIASYLDQEIARIDTIIEAKQSLLKALAEKRQAIVNELITLGIDKTIKTKNSNVEWIGPVPEHWKVERSRWLFKERNQRSLNGDEEMLTVSHLTGVTKRSEKDVNMFEAESNEGYKITHPSDLVINTLWAWMGAMGIASDHGIVSPAYHVYTPSGELSPEYIDLIVRLPKFAAEVTRYSKGVWSSRLRLYPEGFYEVYFPVPPYQEQQMIVAAVKKDTKRIDDLNETAKRTIILLKERRVALITDAVTNKLDFKKDAH